MEKKSSPAWRTRFSILGFSKNVTLCPRSFRCCERRMSAFTCPVPVKDITPKCQLGRSVDIFSHHARGDKKLSAPKPNLAASQHFFSFLQQRLHRRAEPAY